MAYPTDKPSGNYSLRDYNFAENDVNKTPLDEYSFKNGYKNALESKVESVPDAHNHNWIFDLLHRNLRYTMQVAEENKSQLENKIATPTSIGQVKIGYGLEVSSNGVLSVQKGIAEDANIISYDLPVGSYMLWAGNNIPEYFIEPAGQTLLRSAYPELWQFAQDNNLVGKLFTNGDGSTTFEVKDIRGNFISIANSNDKVGIFTEAGLPNITGRIVPYSSHSEAPTGTKDASGCFTTDSGTRSILSRAETTGGRTSGINFSASRSSSIYGKSNTVMPANWGLKLILKALPTPPSNAVPTGTILNYTASGIPDGYIIANGSELSRITFSNLWNWALANNLVKPQSEIPTTAHGFYGDGDGSTTFTIPDLRGVFARYADLASNRGGTSLGNYQEDGLPNISGEIRYAVYGLYNNAYGNSGAFSGSTRDLGTGYWQVQGGGDNNGSYRNNTLRINASLSNSIYGKSQYVQPKSVSITPILKY